MRSSIACTRCRRSKIKCENQGVGSQCKACHGQGRECTYPVAGTSVSTPRRESLTANLIAPGDRTNGDTPQKKRKRTIAPTSNVPYHSKGSPGAAIDAYDPRVLTQQVWAELAEIFDQHFATELPFLHATRFLKLFKQTKAQPHSAQGAIEQSPPPVEPSEDPFLIAFLALTSPFHEKLVHHHSPLIQVQDGPPRGGDPTVASEFYANEALRRLNEPTSRASLQRTQALLMLGYYEWRMNQGLRAYQTITSAICLARAQGLHIEPDLDDLRDACEQTVQSEEPIYESKEDKFISLEIRRRTFWSCFIMDRYLSCGKYRGQMLHLSEIRTQLPCSERSFSFGQNVKTAMLQESSAQFLQRKAELEKIRERQQRQGTDDGLSDDDDMKFEYGSEEDTLARFIRALELFGDILRNWSCLGGRRLEKDRPPWDDDSTFKKYEDKLTDMKKLIPSDLRLSPSRTEAHIRLRTSRNYVQLHAIFTLCSIALHREYMPFLPFECKKPSGPTDAPTFEGIVPPANKGGEDYWDIRAQECFKAAKEFHDLLHTCQEGGVLVETPVTVFAVYHVLVCVLYVQYFPQMDQGQYLCNKSDRSYLEHERERAFAMLKHMSIRSKMAQDQLKTIDLLYQYLETKYRDYNEMVSSPDSNRSGGSTESGRGLSDYKKHFESKLKEFGDIRDQTRHGKASTRDTARPPPLRDPQHTSDSGSPSVTEERMEDVQPTNQTKWTTLNSGRTPSENGTPRPINGHPNYYNTPHEDSNSHANQMSPPAYTPTTHSTQYSPHFAGMDNSMVRPIAPMAAQYTPPMNYGNPNPPAAPPSNYGQSQRASMLQENQQVRFDYMDYVNWAQANDFQTCAEIAARQSDQMNFAYYTQIYNQPTYPPHIGMVPTDYTMNSSLQNKYS